MKIKPGIAGYILLIISAAFIDIPFLALIAMPVFLAGAVMIMVFYLSLIEKEIPKKWIAVSLIVTGTILLSAIVGYSAVDFTEYLVASDRGEVDQYYPSPWLKVILIITLNLLASMIIFIGIKQKSKLNNKNLFLIWLATFLLLPLVITLIKLFALLGVPLSA